MSGSGPGAPAGVLGGTFDPVHLGHLRLAQAIQERLSLDRMLLVPTAVPPHKPQDSLSPIRHREAMLRLALIGRPGLELCAVELDASRVAYTIDTLRALRDGGRPCRPLFILGTDGLLTLPSWHCHLELLTEFDLVTVDRADQPLALIEPRLMPEVRARLVQLPPVGAAGELAALRPGAGGRILHVPLVASPISSSAVRRAAARGDDLEHLVPPEVAQYILAMTLYRQEIRR